MTQQKLTFTLFDVESKIRILCRNIWTLVLYLYTRPNAVARVEKWKNMYESSLNDFNTSKENFDKISSMVDQQQTRLLELSQMVEESNQHMNEKLQRNEDKSNATCIQIQQLTDKIHDLGDVSETRLEKHQLDIADLQSSKKDKKKKK